jgi:protein gp37
MDDTGIPWCDGTCNPGMGCSGLCEMWPTNGKVRNAVINEIVSRFPTIPPDRVETILKRVLQDYAGTILYANRDEYIYDIETAVATAWPGIAVGLSVRGVYERLFKCFAGKLVTMRAGHAGYPASFEVPIIFEGRMAEAARQSSLHGQSRAAKPWLNGCRRLVFISDMGDVLSREIPFDYLKPEIIDQVTSENGSQHMWLWLTKNPTRMVEFDRWLESQGIDWPENLMAMTTVTSNATAYRIETLRKVRAKLKGLSVEPLWEAVTLNLAGIDWCIVGGESGARANAEPFDLDWARSLQTQCELAGTSFFLKQLGSNVVHRGQPQKYRHVFGEDWAEWPWDLRKREVPAVFKCAPAHGLMAAYRH